MRYPNLGMKNNFMIFMFNSDQLGQPLVSLSEEKERKLALRFNSGLYKVCEQDHASDFELYVRPTDFAGIDPTAV